MVRLGLKQSIILLQITSHIQILFGVESALSLETVKYYILLAVWNSSTPKGQQNKISIQPGSNKD